MLKRIRIRNFRSCKDVSLDRLGYATALLGHNGSGKTNIFMGISCFAQLASTTEVGRFVRELILPAPQAPVLSFDSLLDLEGNRYRFNFEMGWEPRNKEKSAVELHLKLGESLSVSVDDKRWEQLFTRRDQELRVANRLEPVVVATIAPSLVAIPALLPDAEDLLKHIRPLLSFFRATRYYLFQEASDIESSNWSGIIPDTEYRQWVTRFESTGDAGDSVVLRILYAYHEHREMFDELSSLLGPKGLELIQSISVEKFELPAGARGKDGPEKETTYHFLRFHPGRLLGGGQAAYSFGQLSLGTRRVLHILVALIVDRCSLMLIEHPEEGIHSGLLKKLVGLLRDYSNPSQIILSSHSADVFNKFKAQDVRLVTIRRGATSVHQLTDEQLDQAASFIQQEGSLAEFLEQLED